MGLIIGILVFALVLAIIIKTSKGNSSDINDYGKQYDKARKENRNHNKERYCKRFDFESYPEKKDENYVEVKGVHIDNRLEPCLICEPDEELMLIRELDNSYDKNAVMVYRFTGEIMGYLPKEEAAIYTPLIDADIPVRAYFGYRNYNEHSDYWQIMIYLVEYKKPGV